MVQNSYNSTESKLAKLFKVSTIDTMVNGRCNTIKWEQPVMASDIILFIFKVPKSNFYNPSIPQTQYPHSSQHRSYGELGGIGAGGTSSTPSLLPPVQLLD